MKLHTSFELCEEEFSSVASVLEGGFWGLLSSSSSLRSSDCGSVGPSRVHYSLKSLIPSLSKRSNSICSILSLVLASCSSLSLIFVSSRSFLPCSKESFFLGMQGIFLSVPCSVCHCFFSRCLSLRMSERTRVFLVDPVDLIRCQNSDTTTQETTPSPPIH